MTPLHLALGEAERAAQRAAFAAGVCPCGGAADCGTHQDAVEAGALVLVLQLLLREQQTGERFPDVFELRGRLVEVAPAEPVADRPLGLRDSLRPLGLE